MNINGQAGNVISLGWAINIHDVYWLVWWHHRGHLHAENHTAILCITTVVHCAVK